ncbi:MAG: hypothetical protein C4527_12945 [Candidatus Omnitrophota bacterium]|jgi:peroxiredoxin|nr:MAG: hypothetical protein C4527_12945 [Candidatus Omnitrophota bacterium]
MKIRYVAWIGLLAGSVFFSQAFLAMEAAAQANEEQAAYKIGDTVAPFTLKDAEGKEHDLGAVLGKKVVVLDFWSSKCPVSIAYEERLKAVQAKYADKDVVVFAIDSNAPNSVEEIATYAKKNKLNYPVLKDHGNKIADRFGAKVTPEVFVICKGKIIQYHGAVDDSQNAANIKNTYLADALDAVLAGNEVDVKESKAFGCTIKRVN